MGGVLSYNHLLVPLIAVLDTIVCMQSSRLINHAGLDTMTKQKGFKMGSYWKYWLTGLVPAGLLEVDGRTVFDRVSITFSIKGLSG